MPHLLDASGNPIRHGRPSPRTQGVTAEGETFQKFGTQQLKFVAPVVYGTPYQGVVQKDVGKTFKMYSIGTRQTDFGAPTVFSQRIIAGITGATPVGASYVPPPAMPNGNGNGTGCECEACKNGTGECSDKVPCCNAWDIGCELFGCIDKHGCECEACKNGTGQCSEKNPKCNAWDIGCEVTEGVTDIITDPVSSGWDKYGIWVYGILAVIGLGILLWLLRPLFGIAKNITGVSKSAVTRVNGMR